MEGAGRRGPGDMTSTPEHNLPEAKRVLVLAPHPDDETLGCGGSIALYASSGVELHLAVISDGGKISHEFEDKGVDVVETRKRECAEAARMLGIKQTYFLGFPDGDLKSFKHEIEIKLSEIIAGFRPDIVFSPSPLDYHSDHIAVSEIALRLLNKVSGMKVAFYEVYETIRFNVLVDITSVMDVKAKVISGYKYSLFHSPEIFSEAVKGLNRFRSFYTRQVKYYEAFWIVSMPLDINGILNWLTYGTMEADPAVVFLSKIKTVDELFFELGKNSSLLKEKESEITSLKTRIKKGEGDLFELKARLEAINGSLWWRLAIKFYRGKDILLPEGSAIR